MQVNRYTRAGRYGKAITCPECDHDTVVYHFSWSALVCQVCKKDIPKKEWTLLNFEDYR